nr:MAG TPA: microtubule-associated protein [Caudoviricetes sp.]
MEVIISAALSAGVTLAVCIINNTSQARQTRSLLDYKLGELTKRVDKHNSVIERTYALEKRVEVQEEQIKVANHRIQDLENLEVK